MGRRVGREPHARVLERSGEHTGDLLGRGRDRAAVRLAGLVERRRSAPTARDEDETRGLGLVRHPRRDPLRLVRGEVADLAHDDDPVRGHERRALQRVDDRREDGHLERRPVAFRLARAVVGRGAPARRDLVLLERERPVLAAEQLLDESLHLAVAQRGIGALHQVGAHSSSA